MKNLNLSQKLYLLSGLLLLNLVVSEVVSYRNLGQVRERLVDVTEVRFPAVRAMMRADMMHDGLRATAYRALIASAARSENEKEAVREEFKEMSDNIHTYFSQIEALPLAPDAKNAVAGSKEHLDQYVKAAGEIVELALAGQAREAFARVPNFQERFEMLQGHFEKLGDLIEKEASASSLLGTQIAARAETLGLALLIGGVIVGALLALWVMRSLMGTLTGLVNRLTQESNLVEGTAQSVTRSSANLSSSTVAQASALQETATAIEEIAAMVRKTSDNSQSLEQAAHKSQESAARGQESISEMLGAMTAIRDSNAEIMQQVEESNRQITDIVRVISEIGNKTKVINDIVFQTKLLSFNASVEAARAGEHGKGFAVVAEEVGNLAQMSGTAAKEIAEMLESGTRKVEGIVADTKQRVDGLVANGRGKVDAGTRVAQQCGTFLQEIVKEVGDVNVMIGEITTAIREQNQGIDEISKAASQLDESTQRNSTTAEQASEAANRLAAQSKALNAIAGTLEGLVGGVRETQAQQVSAQANARPANVVALPKRGEQAKAEAKKTAAALAEVPLKKVVGDQAVPSEDDPRFQDV